MARGLEYSSEGGGGGPLLVVACLDETQSHLILNQYTGFTDDQDVEIYEGDIIDGIDPGGLETPDEHSRVVARWDADWGEWVAHDPFNHEGFDLADYGPLDRVVGNIYQNPDLIKVEA